MTTRREMVGNGDAKQWTQKYAGKTIKKKTKEDIRQYNKEIIRETIMAPESLRTLGQYRLTTLLDKQVRV